MPLFIGQSPSPCVPEYLLCPVPFLDHAEDSHYLVRTRPPRFIAELCGAAEH
jgi:hypothetical protein